LIAHPKRIKFHSLGEELLLLAAGLSGISLYFLAENIALNLSTASNVGLLVSSAPVITAVFAHWMTKDERFRKHLALGFIISIAGIFLILFNGNFVLRLNPTGDILALLAAVFWAMYSIIIKKLGNRYNYLYLTRRIFFYGLITTLPFLIVFRPDFNIRLFALPVVTGHILFLGLAASALCFFLWNTVLHKIGTVKASNYIYLLPLSTMTVSALVLRETITVYMVIGAAFVLTGTYISENSSKKPPNAD
jgi:drug/metabolite transporter (DMT)-like permease